MATHEPNHPEVPDEPAPGAGTAGGRRVHGGGGGDDDDRGYEVPSRTWLVHGAIIVAFAVFITVVSLLFVRWWSGSRVPSATMEFFGDERLAGVQVRVDGTNLDAARLERLTAENGYRVRFAVPAGLYLVQVTRDGHPLTTESTLSLRETDAVQYDLTRLLKPAATNPSDPEEAAAATTQPQQ
jgi:hypothetical protein